MKRRKKIILFLEKKKKGFIYYLQKAVESSGLKESGVFGPEEESDK
jgi:hypothetical protein